MEKISLHRYFFLGTAMRYLQDCEEGNLLKSKDDNGYYILDNLRVFLDELEKLKLFVTKRAAYELLEFYNHLKSHDKENRLLLPDAIKLRKIMDGIRPTFDAEAEGIFAFYVTDKRYSMDNLIGGIDKLFRPSIYNLLSDFAKTDFSEAGYCIAFERPTAAAFHILRGTEDVLRNYYKNFIRKEKQFRSWGQMTSELKNKVRGKRPNVTTLSHLINIKDSFRNPTQHPDKVYDIYEAQDLLNLCIDVVNRMTSELKNYKSAQ